MRLVTCEQGRLHFNAPAAPSVSADAFGAGLPGLAAGHVHELLAGGRVPRTVLAWLARPHTSGAVVWCDPTGGPYPPALAAAGVDVRRVYVLRPKTVVEAVWAVNEAMRCRGVGVTIAALDRLTPVQARRLQLAAEHGGGLGLLVRGRDCAVHSARTRWHVSPARGDRLVQRWKMRLLHGHGRPAGQEIVLEVSRATHDVRAIDVAVDRPGETTPADAAR